MPEDPVTPTSIKEFQRVAAEALRAAETDPALRSVCVGRMPKALAIIAWQGARIRELEVGNAEAFAAGMEEAAGIAEAEEVPEADDAPSALHEVSPVQAAISAIVVTKACIAKAIRARAADGASAGKDDGRIWLVYSREHNAFWRPKAAGYTDRIDAAGRYTGAEARRYCSMRDRQQDGSASEVAVIAPEFAPFAAPAAPEGDPTP